MSRRNDAAFMTRITYHANHKHVLVHTERKTCDRNIERLSEDIYRRGEIKGQHGIHCVYIGRQINLVHELSECLRYVSVDILGGVRELLLSYINGLLVTCTV